MLGLGGGGCQHYDEADSDQRGERGSIFGLFNTDKEFWRVLLFN